MRTPPHITENPEIVTVYGAEVELYKRGNGPPLLLLHCVMGISHWDPYWDDLARQFTVFVPTHPWYGRSGDANDIRDIEDLVFFYSEFIDVMGWQTISIAGISLGAWIALELAATHPDKIDALVIASPLGCRHPDHPFGELFGLSQPELFQVLSFSQNNPTLSRCIGVSTALQSLNPNSFPFYKNMAAAARYCWNPYLHNPKLPRRLRRINCPSLILRGVADKLVPDFYARWVGEMMPNARLQFVENAGHLLHYDAPAEFSRASANFLGQVLSRPAS